MSGAVCIACGSGNTVDLVSIDRVPVLCNELHETAGAARAAPVGRIDLSFCKRCGHYFNRAFDADLMYYSTGYETSLYASAVFRDYAQGLVDRLIGRYGIRNKRILEIGCGRGEFLRQLCTAGDNHGIGFDTSTPFQGPHPEDSRVSYVQDYFSSKYEELRADLIVCQQVLEHIEHPATFLQSLARTATFQAGNPVFYCEVPNGLYTARDLGIWDLIYEHVSYFTPTSLARAFADAGFEVLDSGEVYGGQYLYVEARVGPDRDPLGGDLSKDDCLLAGRFAERFEAKVSQFNAYLEADVGRTAGTYVWGAGSKGITFCNLVDREGRLGGLIDRSAAKRHRFIGTTGLEVFAPDDLSAAKVKGIILMNPRYSAEVRDDLARAGIQVHTIDA